MSLELFKGHWIERISSSTACLKVVQTWGLSPVAAPEMPIILRSLNRSCRLVNTPFGPIRRVPISLSIESRIAPKQRIHLSCVVPVASSKWHLQTRSSSSDQKAKDLNQQGKDKELAEFDDAIETEKEKQTRAPWHREGADQPPVSQDRSAAVMTKGELLGMLWSKD